MLNQPAKPASASDAAMKESHAVQSTADTGIVFAAALERLNRRSVISLLEQIVAQINEHCEKIGVSVEQNVALKAATQKAADLNQNTLKAISAKNSVDPPKNKSTWCVLCAACCAVLCIAVGVLAYLLHTAYYGYLHQNHVEDQQSSETAAVVRQLWHIREQPAAKTADIDAKLKQYEGQIASAATKIADLEVELKRQVGLLQEKTASYEQAIAKMEKCCDSAALVTADIPKAISNPVEQKPETAQSALPQINTQQSSIVLSGVNFDTGTSTLTEGAKQILINVADTLKKSLPDQRFEVAGHTDNRGDATMNQRLSQDRSEAVRDFLIQHEIRKDLLTSQGYGANNPVADNATPEGRAKNRRVELRKQSAR